jgi:hypothetical protein
LAKELDNLDNKYYAFFVLYKLIENGFVELRYGSREPFSNKRVSLTPRRCVGCGQPAAKKVRK